MAKRAERARPALDRATVKRALEALAPYRRLGAAAGVCAAVAAVVGLLPPMMLRRAIDVAAPHRDGAAVNMLGFGALLLLALIAVLAAARERFAWQLGERVAHDVRVRAFEAIRRQDMAFHSLPNAAEAPARLAHGIGAIAPSVAVVATAVAEALAVVVTLIAAVVLSPLVAVAGFAGLIAAAALSGIARRSQRSFARARAERLDRLESHAAESIGSPGAALAKSLGRDRLEEQRFETESRETLDLQERDAASVVTRAVVASSALPFIVGAVAMTAVHRAAAGRITTGTLVALLAFQIRILLALPGLRRAGAAMASALDGFRAAFGIVDEAPGGAEPLLTLDRPRGHLAFHNVTVAREGSAVLRAATFDVAPGRSLALLGPTPDITRAVAGLITRLEEPAEGTITLDGHDLRELAPESVTAAVGVVAAGAHLLAATVRENLRYARPDARESEVAEAAKAARVHDVVLSLPDGYDTRIGDGGRTLTPSQIRRLVIARVLLQDPAVVLVDESLDGLEPEAARDVEHAIATLTRNRTAIVVAQRAVTLTEAGQVVFFDGARIAEQGTHAELLAANGRYARLYRARFATEPRLTDVLA